MPKTADRSYTHCTALHCRSKKVSIGRDAFLSLIFLLTGNLRHWASLVWGRRTSVAAGGVDRRAGRHRHGRHLVSLLAKVDLLLWESPHDCRRPRPLATRPPSPSSLLLSRSTSHCLLNASLFQGDNFCPWFLCCRHRLLPPSPPSLLGSLSFSSIKLCNLEAAFFPCFRKGPQEQFSIVVELSWHASRRSTVAFTWPLSVPRSLSLSP